MKKLRSWVFILGGNYFEFGLRISTLFSLSCTHLTTFLKVDSMRICIIDAFK